MSSFFDNMKKKLGMTQPPTAFSGTGQILGSRGGTSSSNNGAAGYFTGYNNEETAEYSIFELTFLQEKMGMSINEFTEMLPIDNKQASRSIPTSRAIVSAVKAGSEGQDLGVMVGDIIVSLNKHQLTNFEDFYNFIVALGRPMTIQFYRPYKRVASTPSSATSSTAAAAANAAASTSTASGTAASTTSTTPTTTASSTTSGGTMNNLASTFFRPFSANKSSTPSSSNKTPAITEEEKASRREAMSRAATDRSQAWDKKVTGSKSKKDSAPSSAKDNDLPPPPPTEDTQRIIEKVKEEEQRIANQLGYSPFQPHMSFSGNGVHPPQPPIPSAIYGPAVPVSTLTPEEEDELELMRGEVDDAFAMIISLGDSEQERAKAAVQTIQKMLLNLNNNKQEMKFRSIRLSNKAFQGKVGCISGGIELLIAAGYHYQSTGAEGVSIIDPSNTETLSSKNSNENMVSTDVDNVVFNENVEEYLVHDMDIHAEKKLKYTISRLNEILEMQNTL